MAGISDYDLPFKEEELQKDCSKLPYSVIKNKINCISRVYYYYYYYWKFYFGLIPKQRNYSLPECIECFYALLLKVRRAGDEPKNVKMFFKKSSTF